MYVVLTAIKKRVKEILLRSTEKKCKYKDMIDIPGRGLYGHGLKIRGTMVSERSETTVFHGRVD